MCWIEKVGVIALEQKDRVGYKKTNNGINDNINKKNILIIGENSYIGSRFAKYVGNQFNITTVGARNGKWKEIDFSDFDSILHCAGIAHVSQKKHMKALYYSVNCDLAVNVAKKAKNQGVKQFIFLSSILVYGRSDTEISIKTVPNPESFYGDSKFRAEKILYTLSDSEFNICVIRPPIVYGFGCKGNFPKLVWLAKKLPIFPNVDNKRSMIYIDNLCAFISYLIKDNCNGIHLPQNKEYVNTTLLVQTIAKLHGKKIRTTKIFNPLIYLLMKFISPINKLFGDLFIIYSEKEKINYHVVEFEHSVRRSIYDEDPM